MISLVRRALAKGKRLAAAPALDRHRQGLEARQRMPDPLAFEELRRTLEGRYDPAFLAYAEGQADLANHLTNRLDIDRRAVVPWIDRLRPLDGARILEIGCGTGSSTVAMAEQGADVVGVDIQDGSIDVARLRCRAYGLDTVQCLVADAADLPADIRNQRFDIIIFFASLEHMLHHERMASLRAAWDMLPSGGLLCLTDTPNRLWYEDSHGALMPFFHWLPDDLAFQYVQFSKRGSLHTKYDRTKAEDFERFLKGCGRGVSYHEFELALGPLESLNIDYRDRDNIQRIAATDYASLPNYDRYVKIMMEITPDISPGFFLPSLDISLMKP